MQILQLSFKNLCQQFVISFEIPNESIELKRTFKAFYIVEVVLKARIYKPHRRRYSKTFFLYILKTTSISIAIFSSSLYYYAKEKFNSTVLTVEIFFYERSFSGN